MSGYKALHSGAAWLNLSDRAKIRVTGDDRLRLLHALASNAVEGLQPGQGERAFFLDVHGHILVDARIWVFDDHVLIDAETETRQVLLDHLEKYIIMDDVALEDVTDTLAMVAVEGREARRVVGETWGQVPDQPENHAGHKGVTVIAASISGAPGCRLLAKPADRPDLTRRLEALGVIPATREEATVVRVENAIPRHTEDFFARTLPQESGRMNQVSFTKGCYLGQEIVERIRARGEVRRELVPVEIDTSEPPAAGSPVLRENREVGVLTSPVFSPRRERCLGFSIVRREALQPGYPLRIGAYEARVVPLTGP
jgi:aminomethyltransferase